MDIPIKLLNGETVIRFFPDDWKTLIEKGKDLSVIPVHSEDKTFNIVIQQHQAQHENDYYSKQKNWYDVALYDARVFMEGGLISSNIFSRGTPFAVNVDKSTRFNVCRWDPVDSFPFHLRDRVAWALGADPKLQACYDFRDMTEHELDINQDSKSPYTMIRYRYGMFYASVCFDTATNAPIRGLSRYYVDGWPTKAEAIEVLENAITLNGWHFSTPGRIAWVLNRIR